MSKQQENKNTLGAQMEFIARITMSLPALRCPTAQS